MRHGSDDARRAARPSVAALGVAALGVAGLVGLGATWVLARPGTDPARTAVAAPGTAPSVPAADPAGSPSPDPGPASAPPSPPSPPSDPTPSASPGPTPSAPGGTPRPPKGLTAADVAAGLRSAAVPQRGTGRLAIVPGTVRAPGSGRVIRVRVEVEGGLRVDGGAFADFALATLNDRRSWARDGYRFARTDGAADVRLVLAAPDTSAQLCRPLRTFGKLSCHAGDLTVITLYRWVKGMPEYGADLTGYRHYVVNHEVGHALGHGHLSCPGAGKRAPVMMQQTKGLKGCRPNGWPYPT